MKQKEFSNGLIVQSRKSAVFFMKNYNKNNIKEYTPIRNMDGKLKKVNTGEFHISREETDVSFVFKEGELQEFINYMKTIGEESWKEFKPKEADSMRTDYDSYWDKDLQDEGNLYISNRGRISVEAPYQEFKNQDLVRLYKFDKRKFESFVYDLIKYFE